MKEVILNSIEVQEITYNLHINDVKMHEDLKGFVPTLKREELFEFYSKIYHMDNNGKSTYCIKVR